MIQPLLLFRRADAGVPAAPRVGEIAPRAAIGTAPSRSRSTRLVDIMGRTIIIGIIGTGLNGCSSIEPWVKPYERQALADPIMSLNRHPISTAYMHHVYEAREGARGAVGGTGGGCGCN